MIIPVYNVEKYLAKCIDSVIAQTYTELEILLIDDGSTDSSGEICDSYSSRDKRIRVIHQQNKGLAEVRNIGIREAKGEWIQFVDSDDWIDPETVGTCLEYARKYDAEIVCFGFMKDYGGGRRTFLREKSRSPFLMTKSEALSRIFFQTCVSTSSCDKFFRASVLSSIEYPRNKLWEDAYTMYKIIAKAERILSTGDSFYHYCMRGESIIHGVSEEKLRFATESGSECYSFIMGNFQLTKSERRDLDVGFSIWMLGVVNMMLKADATNGEYISSLRRSINVLDVLRCPYIGIVIKAQLIIFKTSVRLYRLLYLKLRRDKA